MLVAVPVFVCVLISMFLLYGLFKIITCVVILLSALVKIDKYRIQIIFKYFFDDLFTLGNVNSGGKCPSQVTRV